MKTTEFAPKILAFCCNYCAYAAADLAGVSRMQYPPNVRIVRLPCSGKVDITYLLRAFQAGVDGVFVAGCLKGGCHFVEGNLRAEKRVQLAKNMLDAIGVGGERLEMFFLSSAMAPRFVGIVSEMTERIRKLGPTPLANARKTEKLKDLTKREFLYHMLSDISLIEPKAPIPVPEGVDEFGRVEHRVARCIGCRRCEEACPEKALKSSGEFDLPAILEAFQSKEKGSTKIARSYESIAKLALRKQVRSIPLPTGLDEFSRIRYMPERCVICDKCVDICPEKAMEVVKEIDIQTIFKAVRAR